jgi:hypothetical protein
MKAFISCAHRGFQLFIDATTRPVAEKRSKSGGPAKELLQTFDPRIKRLRRRRKILIHKDAFDDLE